MIIYTKTKLDENEALCLATMQKEEPNYSIYPFDAQFPAYLAVDSKVGVIGILTWCVANPTDAEAEFTVLVAKEFRRQGVATALIARAKSDILADFNGCRFVATLGILYRSSSLAAHPAYEEYFEKLTRERFDEIYMNAPEVPFDAEFEAAPSLTESHILYKGEVIAECHIDHQKSFSNLYHVEVAPEYRNKGVATAMIYRTAGSYFNVKEQPLILNVRSTNEAAVNLYRTCGFSITNRIPFYYL